MEARSSSNTLVERVKSWWSLDLIEGSDVYTLDLQRKKKDVCIYEHIHDVIVIYCASKSILFKVNNKRVEYRIQSTGMFPPFNIKVKV